MGQKTILHLAFCTMISLVEPAFVEAAEDVLTIQTKLIFQNLWWRVGETIMPWMICQAHEQSNLRKYKIF